MDRISFEKLYESFFAIITIKNELRIHAFNCIHNRTALVKKVNENMRSDIETLDKKFHHYEEEWNQSVDSIRKIYDTLRQQKSSDTLPKEILPFLIDLDKIIREWAQQSDRAHRSKVKQFIIDKLNSNFFENHKSLEIAITIQNHNINATMSYINMENILRLYANLFSTYSRIHGNYCRIIPKAQKILNRTALP